MPARTKTKKCKSCTKPAEPGRTRCARHAAKNREKQRKRTETRLAAGLCPICGKPKATDSRNCRKHASQMRRWGRDWRKRKTKKYWKTKNAQARAQRAKKRAALGLQPHQHKIHTCSVCGKPKHNAATCKKRRGGRRRKARRP